MSAEQETETSQSKPEAQEQTKVENEVIAEEKQATETIVNEDENVHGAEEDVADTLSIEALQKQLETAEKKATENLDKALRAQAEMENLKRRTQKDLESAHKYALEGFAKELLPVMDSLELGLQAATGDSEEVQKFREGTELTLKQFDTVFSKFNIEKIDPTGEPFNPELHQAMTMQPSDEAEPNTVLNVFQKGYTLNGRLIRPALVVVAQAAK